MPERRDEPDEEELRRRLLEYRALRDASVALGERDGTRAGHAPRAARVRPARGARRADAGRRAGRRARARWPRSRSRARRRPRSWRARSPSGSRSRVLREPLSAGGRVAAPDDPGPLPVPDRGRGHLPRHPRARAPPPGDGRAGRPLRADRDRAVTGVGRMTDDPDDRRLPRGAPLHRRASADHGRAGRAGGACRGSQAEAALVGAGRAARGGRARHPRSSTTTTPGSSSPHRRSARGWPPTPPARRRGSRRRRSRRWPWSPTGSRARAATSSGCAGVDSDYVIRSLLHRRLVAEVGRRDTPGRPVLFGTTFTFLERFGLTSLDDLPPLSSDAAQLAALTEPARRGRWRVSGSRSFSPAPGWPRAAGPSSSSPTAGSASTGGRAGSATRPIPSSIGSRSTARPLRAPPAPSTSPSTSRAASSARRATSAAGAPSSRLVDAGGERLWPAGGSTSSRRA